MVRKLLVPMFLLLTVAASAQVKMRDLLVQVPDTVVPYLSANAWLDFIDFYDSNMKAEVSNSLDGKSELLKLTDNYASLRLTNASAVEMRLLDTDQPVDSVSQIVCLVRSYGDDISDSVLEFYSVNWRPLPVAGRVALPAGMCRLVLGEDEPTLTVVPDTKLDAPANEEQKEIEIPSTFLKWNGNSFN